MARLVAPTEEEPLLDATRLVGSLADPAYRPEYITRHRSGSDPMFAAIHSTSEKCGWTDGVVLCGHAKACGCHAMAPSERQAGLVDILAHPFVGHLLRDVRYLSYVPGAPEWLTSPTPTPDAWYEQGREESGA
jgi:hypothetical protein